MDTTGKLVFTPHGEAIASHDPDEPYYLPHAGSLSPEIKPDPEPGVSDEQGPRMRVRIWTINHETVKMLMGRCELDVYSVCQYLGKEGLLVMHFLNDSLYRDIDRFCDHCQAIRLIRDWRIER